MAQAALRCELEDLYVQHNDARDGTTCIAAEYLEVVGTRAEANHLCPELM